MSALQQRAAMHSLKTDLIRRIPTDKPYASEVRQIVENCFNLQDALAFKRQAIAEDRSLTYDSRNSTLHDFVTGEFARDLANASRGARTALANAAKERAATFDGKRIKDLDDLRDSYQVAKAAADIVTIDMANALRTTPDRMNAIVQGL